MIVQNAIDSEQSMAVAINAHHLRGEGFSAAIGIDRGEGRGFGLRALGRAPENFTGGGVKEARRFGQVAQDFQQAQGAHGGEFTGGFGDFKAEPDMALAGKVIKFAGFDLV